jgi:Flp pilus assembly protein TadB
MMRRRVLLAALVTVATLAGGASGAPPVAASESSIQVTPIGRLPFPERGFVVSVPGSRRLDSANVVVKENGLRVSGTRVDPLARSGLRYGVVLAIDASESMAGRPAAAALEAGRTFLTHRTSDEEIGVVAFNGDIAVLSGMTQDGRSLHRTLEAQPRLAYGTRIYDGLVRSLALLRDAKLASGSIVVLSDGADIGSLHSASDAVAAARKQKVRIFTVGLRSGAYDPAPLRSIARRTGGAYAEARSADELARIYESLGAQLAGEHLVRYRSAARPMSQVEVQIEVADAGQAATTYVAPTPSLLAPYHRSPLAAFLLSGGSPLVLALFFGLLVCGLLLLLIRRPRTTMVDRVESFAGASRGHQAEHAASVSLRAPPSRYATGWWSELERDLELARMTVTARQVVGMALLGTFAIFVIALLLSAPLLGLFGLTTPLIARSIIRRKVKAIRDEFADQFPGSLQVLASALRSGHSFNGALGVVVDHAREPARAELARVLQDDRLGVLPEDAIRKLGRRMDNRDIEQVALLAELQRTAGGNSAEILDTVVGTIRERAEIRRLVRTLTAQGRMARWILTAMPIFLAAFLWLVHADAMANFFSSSGGQIALVLAAAMVTAGSFVIQKIVDIDV